ncbi:MAG: hypothetical protein IT566_04785 [Rhodospirillaceae bacterium]|nr:hypothetical protein [Rhodospirillaceae bacterium]
MITSKKLLGGVCAAALAFAASTASADTANPDVAKVDITKTRSIAYTLTYLNWALQYTADAKECPNGFNDGPREQFKILFPEDGTKRTYIDTVLSREITGFYPDQFKEPFTLKQAVGPVAPGLNLDGKVDADDFISPAGEKGVDNQFYRGLGCIESYRGPDAYNNFYDTQEILEGTYNRMLFEITELDSLQNDPDVVVTMYRGTHPVLRDASGNTIGFKGIPGGTEKLDLRWGKKYVQRYKGKIENGVLITEPATYTFPWQTFGTPTDETIYQMRMRLDLNADYAEGLMGGYLDFASFHSKNMRSDSTHHQSYGRLPSALLYQTLQQIADGPVDPATGKRNSVSSALVSKWAQVYIIGRDNKTPVAEAPAAARSAAGER